MVRVCRKKRRRSCDEPTRPIADVPKTRSEVQSRLQSIDLLGPQSKVPHKSQDSDISQTSPELLWRTEPPHIQTRGGGEGGHLSAHQHQINTCS